MKYRFLFLVFFILSISCNSKKDVNYQEFFKNDANVFHNSIKEFVYLIVHDIVSPPVSSRMYMYSFIAAYEASRFDNNKFKTFAGKLNGLDSLPTPKDKNISFFVAGIKSFFVVSYEMIFSQEIYKKYEDSVMQNIKEKVDSKTYNNSIKFGEEIGKAILQWAKKDNYAQTRSMPKYSLVNDESKWSPTPPGYMEGVEPNWNKIRTLTLDSASMFKPLPPPKYDLDKNSNFYKELMEVYEVGNKLTDEQKHIASFWDCNPYAIQKFGHIMFAIKKISPGGHWVLISSQVAKEKKLGYVESLYAYSMVSIGLFDGFISCWDEKYRSRHVRPETVINKKINDNWMPFLQTPPFPEYTSGHSVISSASSSILTELYGDNFKFIDSTERVFGIEDRSFNSFYEASAEAAISRLYGGIHYRSAIVNGIEQGKKVALKVLSKTGITKL